MDHWIGLTNMIDGWVYTWQDNTPVDYVRWAPTQPNSDKGCVVLKTATNLWEWEISFDGLNFLFRSQACANQLPFVCIFDPTRNSTCPVCPTFPPCPTCPPPPVCNTTVSIAKNMASASKKVPSQAVSSKVEQKLNSICPPGYIYVDSTQRLPTGNSLSF